ncbi:hypothetical protein [Chryseobacterium sp. HSC-36S06]|uniref:hypothetical protein n=1 Tax=Chryseobacterium sp. HSC-36S06 TaxID=2910970 RepID=UPI0020A04FF3|nr:hypothetical protein [Chryseobacterium sp. HSC-36S06]MCP2038527.1 hypothetical protein [Chryseobacterium sp. HSC-36S06]
MKHTIFFLFLLFIFVSCKTREKNYIHYYNRVNEIDSIYRIADKPLIAVRKYKRLVRKYEPKNQERLDEFENYIYLSDQYSRNFGGKKTLIKFAKEIAPYGDSYKKHLPLFQKYGIDSIEIKSELLKWENSRDKVLMDSITTIFVRDQAGKRADVELMMKNDRKNANAMKWIITKYGFPSLNKVGLMGNDNVFLPLLTFFSHMSASEEYPYFESQLKHAVKTGECPPRVYSTMVDRYHLEVKKDDILYAMYLGMNNISDSAQIDRNRKSIGLPTMNHNKIITKDFFKKLKRSRSEMTPNQPVY